MLAVCGKVLYYRPGDKQRPFEIPKVTKSSSKKSREENQSVLEGPSVLFHEGERKQGSYLNGTDPCADGLMSDPRSQTRNE